MPFSIVHIEIWAKLKDYLPTEDNLLEFLAWSIFVDSSYNLKELWIDIKREVTHYYNWDSYYSSDFPSNFKKMELDKNFTYFNLWYYYHLLLDQLWRDSEFVWDCYKDVDKENLYQLSRIVYSKYDLDAFIEDFWLSILDKLYSFKLDKNKIPYIYSDIDLKYLQKTYLSIIDYMRLTKTFRKIEWDREFYKIVDNKIIIIDNDIEKQMHDFFPFEKYTKLKTTWYNILKENFGKIKN